MNSTVPPPSVLKVARALVEAFGTPPAPAPPVARYVKIDLAAQRTGYSASAIRSKMDKGVWLEGREFIKAPDGERLVDMEGYEQWVLRGRGKG